MGAKRWALRELKGQSGGQVGQAHRVRRRDLEGELRWVPAYVGLVCCFGRVLKRKRNRIRFVF